MQHISVHSLPRENEINCICVCVSSVIKGKPEDQQEEEDENTVVYKTPHSKTVIVYKKDFVPYTTRIYNFIKSFSSEPGTGDK